MSVLINKMKLIKDQFIMNKFYKLIFMAALTLGAAPFFASCSDDEADEWNATYVYLQREDFLVSTVKTFNLTHDASGIGGDEINMVFTAKTQKPTAKDITVKLGVKSESEGLDVNKISLSTTEITIKAGQQASEEVIATIDRTIFSTIEDKASYSFSISINEITTDNGNTIISSNLKTLPATINKSAYCNLKSGTPVNSKLWTAKTEWNFAFQDGVENQNTNSVIGNGGSDVATNGVPFWLTVDLKTVKTLTGIQSKHWGSGFAPTQIEVYYSDNGSTWKSMGVIDTKGGTQNVAFVTPIQTRYLKYQMIKVPGRVDLTAFYVYIPSEE